MKKLLLFLLLIVSASSIQAQDVIVKIDGSTVVCRVVEVNASEIVYKKWTDLNGSNYVMNRADASAINYQSGKRENLGEMTNLYAPNNQNDGVQMLNDKALLEMDYSTEGWTKKVRKLKNTGLIGGGIILGGTVLGIAIGTGGFDTWDPELNILLPAAVVASAGWTIGYYMAANNVEKKAMRSGFSIYQQEFKLKNGSLLTAGVDMLKDQMLNTQTIGVGLSYNF